MLDIDIDSRMGILFVRLFGRLDKDTDNILNKKVLKLISTVGIRNMVINIQNVNTIDEKGLKTLKKCYSLCDKSILCINPSQAYLMDNLVFTEDELSAVNLIGV